MQVVVSPGTLNFKFSVTTALTELIEDHKSTETLHPGFTER